MVMVDGEQAMAVWFSQTLAMVKVAFGEAPASRMTPTAIVLIVVLLHATTCHGRPRFIGSSAQASTIMAARVRFFQQGSKVGFI
jgi:hypothetical protein